MIAGYVNSSEFGEALALFSTMWVDPTVSVDPFVLSLAVKACGLSMDLHLGESLHRYSIKTGLINSVFVGTALLDMYMKVGITRSGCKLFNEMPVRSVVTWTAVITGLVRCGYNKEGLVYVSEMSMWKLEPDSFTYAIALKACADLGALQLGKAIHARTMKNGFHVTSFVANSLASMYNKCGKLNYGLSLFERMRTKDVVSWTTVITTCEQMGHDVQAIEAFMQMQQSHVSPNEYTFAAVVSVCSNLLRGDWGEQLHGHTLQIGLADSFSVANSIISMYSKCGKLSSASMVFHGMVRKDIVSWSTIIAGYSQGGRGNEAFELLLLMRREGPSSNESALASVLSACGNMATLEQGKQLHAHTISIGLEEKSMIQSALINMYSKGGSIDEASRIFNAAKKDDIVSWTAMINGYAEHGRSFEAIDLFKCIPNVGLRPDSVTFLGVLSACSHSGLVDLGFHYFNLMSLDYKICPSKEHYGCMIHLLCRAGRLKDAESMIKSMPHERDDVVWSTLLWACRIHGDVDCGKMAAEQILAVNPDCAGTHITLANIYSSKGRWREAADMRKLMRSKGVVKEPGWSWIKIKDQVFTFVAGDCTQAECEEIYGMLALLATRTEVSDYVLQN